MHDPEPLALGSLGLSTVECHELEGLGFALRGDERGTDLQCVGRSKRVCLDEPLRETLHRVDHRDLGPTRPSLEEFTARRCDLPPHPRLGPAPPGKCRQYFHSRARPDRHRRTHPFRSSSMSRASMAAFRSAFAIGTRRATGLFRSSTVMVSPARTRATYRERLFFSSAILACFIWP